MLGNQNTSSTADLNTEEQNQQSNLLNDFKIRIVILTPFTKLTLQLPGHTEDLTAVTFQILDEDHTLGNALRYIIMKKYTLNLRREADP